MIVNQTPEERYVLGVVLEPEVVDFHGHIYSAEDIRQAAHGFLADRCPIKLSHQYSLGEGVKVVESYLAPADCVVNGSSIRAGSWLLGLKIDREDVWHQIKSGELTGLSIKGDCWEIDE